MSDRDADVIVIGSGHNGLTAACYLARAGSRVLVVEAAPRVGGMTSTESLVEAAPDHRINPCAVDMILLRASGVVEELGLARFGFEMREVDPSFVHLGPDGESLAIHRDPVRTAEEIRRFSPKDAEAYVDLMEVFAAALAAGVPALAAHPTRPGVQATGEVFRALARHPGKLARVAPMLRRSGAEVLDDVFSHPTVKAPMAVLCGLGPLSAPASAAFLIVFGLVHTVGVSRVVGGTQSLPDALVACLRSDGGDVRTSSPVEEIVIGRNGTEGVRLANGEVLRAPAVVAACDPVTTLAELVPARHLPDRVLRRVRGIPTANDNMASFKVDVALSGRLELGRHQAARSDDLDLRVPTALIGTMDDVLVAHEQSKRGDLPTPQPMYGVIPTAFDPTQAPAGKDTLYLWQGWVPGSPRERWDTETEAVGKTVFAEAAKYYDGLEELEIGRYVEAWPQLVDRTSATDGALFHVDVRPSRMGPMRPAPGLGGHRTPVDGLFLCGNGTHPGSGVSGISGRNAAATVLRVMNR